MQFHFSFYKSKISFRIKSAKFDAITICQNIKKYKGKIMEEISIMLRHKTVFKILKCLATFFNSQTLIKLHFLYFDI